MVEFANRISEAPRRKISVLLALLIMIAVATILITPDPTDDVYGTLRSHHEVQLLTRGAGPGTSLVLLSLAALAAASPPIQTIPNLLRLMCTCRC